MKKFIIFSLSLLVGSIQAQRANQGIQSSHAMTEAEEAQLAQFGAAAPMVFGALGDDISIAAQKAWNNVLKNESSFNKAYKEIEEGVVTFISLFGKEFNLEINKLNNRVQIKEELSNQLNQAYTGLLSAKVTMNEYAYKFANSILEEIAKVLNINLHARELAKAVDVKQSTTVKEPHKAAKLNKANKAAAKK